MTPPAQELISFGEGVTPPVLTACHAMERPLLCQHRASWVPSPVLSERQGRALALGEVEETRAGLLTKEMGSGQEEGCRQAVHPKGAAVCMDAQLSYPWLSWLCAWLYAS